MKSFYFKEQPKFQTLMIFYNLYIHILIINACLFCPIVLLFRRVTTCKQISFQLFKMNKLGFWKWETFYLKESIFMASFPFFYKTKFFVIESIVNFVSCYVYFWSQLFHKYRFLSLHEMIQCSISSTTNSLQMYKGKDFMSVTSMVLVFFLNLVIDWNNHTIKQRRKIFLVIRG